MSADNYVPVNNTTVTLSVTQANTQGTLTPVGRANKLLVQNFGASTAYFRVGAGAQTAVVTDTPIPAYKSFCFAMEDTFTGIAAICDTGLTATLKASQMYGV